MIALREAPQATASLDKPIDDEGQTALGDLLESDDARADRGSDRAERTDAVASALDDLPRPSARSSSFASGSPTDRRSPATRSRRSSA